MRGTRCFDVAVCICVVVRWCSYYLSKNVGFVCACSSFVFVLFLQFVWCMFFWHSLSVNYFVIIRQPFHVFVVFQYVFQTFRNWCMFSDVSCLRVWTASCAWRASSSYVVNFLTPLCPTCLHMQRIAASAGQRRASQQAQSCRRRQRDRRRVMLQAQCRSLRPATLSPARRAKETWWCWASPLTVTLSVSRT